MMMSLLEDEKRKINYHRRSFLMISLFSCLFLVSFFSFLKPSFNGVSLSLSLSLSNSNSPSFGAVNRSLRDRPPSTYALNVDSYSKLVATRTEKYESDVFQAGGYDWTLVLYPTGNTKDNGANHVSLYLSVYNPGSLDKNWEIYTQIKFFVYNKPRNKYLTVEDTEVQRFDAAKTEWGLGQVITLETFNNGKNGYLVGDSCQFGVEVVVLRPYQNSERLTLYEKPADRKFTWRILAFSRLDKSKFLYSGDFLVAGSKWKLRVAPGGDGDGWGNSLSVYVELHDTQSFRVNEKVYARANIRVLNSDPSKNAQKQLGKWFSKNVPALGFQKFMPLSDLNDPSKGYVVGDRLNLEVEFDLVSKTQYTP
ncbi:PREDICTED: uncharacterized protein LOC104817003 [Tarenaya hassleriana]|uniref:uncharacterized protein LOC104817003 n=1 Tax=Tarenaya hassleriana TaxID=28532 RepID=UPI00053C7A5C|nr:PREDICTED: uncharacterized protein LOC104817003 [Tarenaya hassleriana]